MGKILGTAWAAVCLIFIAMPLGAQQTGEIRGKITEEKGEVLPGVSITATSPSLQGIRTALSDEDGKFRLPLLPVGAYSLTFELSGFEKLTMIDQKIHLGFTVDIPVTMNSARLSAEITVKAPTPLIDKTKIDTSYRLNSDDLSRIPTQARTITEVVGLTPGVTGVRVNTLTGGSNFGATPHAGYSGETGAASFRGEGDLGNNWLIDGLSSKGAAANVPGVSVNYDAWDEVQIISDGFTPQMGQGLGGFINIVTKSGGNNFHGELGGMIRDHGLRAPRREQLSAATVPQTSLDQYFGNLGGPIIKDKLWFFLSDNYFRALDSTSEQSVGWLSVPAGNRRVNTNNLLGKVTLTPIKNHTLALSGTSDNFISQSGGIGVPETYTKWVNNIFYYRLNYQGILSPDTLLTAAWGQNRRVNSSRPLNDDYGPPAYYWQDIALATNNAEFSWSAIDKRTDLSASLTHYFSLGRWSSHELKAGLSYYENLYDVNWPSTGVDFDPWPGNGFDDGAEVYWATSGIPIQLMEKAPYHPKNSTRGFGAHIQDSLTLGHLSLMLGLRSDTQQVFNDLGEPGWRWGFGDFLQPRASFAFDLNGNGKNIIKFGYGRFALPISCLDLQGMVNKTITGFRLYEWLGPENPTNSQLSDPSNWGFFFEQSTTATPRDVDPALKPNTMNKFLLEFDRQLGSNWALKIRGIYSYSKNLIEDIGIYDPTVQGGVRFLFTNFELKRRDYRALEFELNGKIADKLMVNASYTWSGAKGTNTGNNFELYQWDLGWGDTYGWSFFGDHAFVPNGAPEKEFIDTLYHGFGGRGIGDEGWYGFLPYSVDHLVKILGTYLAPYGLAFSSNIEYLSGYHWEKKGWSEVGMFVLFPEGRGGRTTPAHLYVDLAVGKDFRMKNGMSIGVGLNAYNLLNSQKPVSYAKQDSELFGQVWARQLPRWVQLKMTLRF